MAGSRIRSEQGFTLVEVLVTIVIGMVVLAAALMLMTQGFQSSAKVQDRHDSAGRARLTLDRATSLLQAQQCNGTAKPMLVAGPNRVEFTANIGDLGADPVHYTLEYVAEAGGGKLLESDGAAPSRVLLDRVVPQDAATPVFRYFGTDDTLTNAPVELGAGLNGALGITDSSMLGRVLRVDVALKALPTRTKTTDDRTASLIRTSAFVASNIDPTKLNEGPQCS